MIIRPGRKKAATDIVQPAPVPDIAVEDVPPQRIGRVKSVHPLAPVAQLSPDELASAVIHRPTTDHGRAIRRHKRLVDMIAKEESGVGTRSQRAARRAQIRKLCYELGEPVPKCAVPPCDRKTWAPVPAVIPKPLNEITARLNAAARPMKESVDGLSPDERQTFRADKRRLAARRRAWRGQTRNDRGELTSYDECNDEAMLEQLDAEINQTIAEHSPLQGIESLEELPPTLTPEHIARLHALLEHRGRLQAKQIITPQLQAAVEVSMGLRGVPADAKQQYAARRGVAKRDGGDEGDASDGSATSDESAAGNTSLARSGGGSLTKRAPGEYKLAKRLSPDAQKLAALYDPLYEVTEVTRSLTERQFGWAELMAVLIEAYQSPETSVMDKVALSREFREIFERNRRILGIGTPDEELAEITGDWSRIARSALVKRLLAGDMEALKLVAQAGAVEGVTLKEKESAPRTATQINNYYGGLSPDKQRRMQALDALISAVPDVARTPANDGHDDAADAGQSGANDDGQGDVIEGQVVGE